MHAGAEVRHLGEWFGQEVDLDDAGHGDVEWYVRGPVTGRGETSQRLYVVGRRPL